MAGIETACQAARFRDAREITIAIRKTLDDANQIADRAVDKVYGTSPSSDQCEPVAGDGLIDALNRLEVSAMFLRDKLARIDRGLHDHDAPKPMNEPMNYEVQKGYGGSRPGRG